MLPPHLTGETEGSSREASAGRVAETDRFNGQYLAGHIAVCLQFLESEGDLENWTEAAKQDAFNSAMEGWHWWCEQAFDFRMAHLFFMIELHWEVPTTYEPIDGEPMPHGQNILCFASWDFDWIGEALNFHGYSGNWNGVFAHCNDLRQQYHTRWAFEVYMVRADNDGNHLFDSFPSADYAYAYRYVTPCHWVLTRDTPIVVLTHWDSKQDLDYSCAHETGHVFGAADEYESGCDDCSKQFGYLWMQNGNCVSCNDHPVPCIMWESLDEPCYFTRGQIGWQDSDSDSIPDAIKPNSN